MKKSVIFSIATVIVLSFTACNKHENSTQANNTQSEQVAQKATESTTNSANTAKEAAAKTIEATKEAAQKVAESTKEATQKAKEAVNKAAEAAKEVANKATEAAKEGVQKATAAAKEVANKAKEAVAAATGADNKGKTLYAKCQSCHGVDGKTHALGKSAVIAGQSEEELVKKIEEYKAGTRNVAGMGALMSGQVKSLSDEDIKALAKYISSLK